MIKDKHKFLFPCKRSVTGNVLLTSFYNYHKATFGNRFGKSAMDPKSGQKIAICNGCGPAGFGALVPETILGVTITEAANIHNWMYLWGENRKDKLLSDETFGDNIDRFIRAAFIQDMEYAKAETNRFKRWYKLRKAYKLYNARLVLSEKVFERAVRVFGKSAFWDKSEPDFLYEEIGR